MKYLSIIIFLVFCVGCKPSTRSYLECDEESEAERYRIFTECRRVNIYENQCVQLSEQLFPGKNCKRHYEFDSSQSANSFQWKSCEKAKTKTQVDACLEEKTKHE